LRREAVVISGIPEVRCDIFPQTRQPERQASNSLNSRTILMGGGVGFQSKTIVGEVCADRALKVTAGILDRAFPKHEHRERDPEEGVSPRALKQTEFNHAFYLYGVCEVHIR
jgi:hypothetical protein